MQEQDFAFGGVGWDRIARNIAFPFLFPLTLPNLLKKLIKSYAFCLPFSWLSF